MSSVKDLHQTIDERIVQSTPRSAVGSIRATVAGVSPSTRTATVTIGQSTVAVPVVYPALPVELAVGDDVEVQTRIDGRLLITHVRGRDAPTRTVLSAPVTSSIITLALAADVNDWAPDGGAGAYRWRLYPIGATRTVTGVQAGTIDGEEHKWTDVSTQDVVLPHENAGSLAANRFLCPNATNLTLDQFDGVTIWYDLTSLRWRVEGV